MSDEDERFEFDYPVRVLANKNDSEPGKTIYTVLSFPMKLEDRPTKVNCMPIFTDDDWAERFMAEIETAPRSILKLGKVQLIHTLRISSKNTPFVAFDPPGTNGPKRLYPIEVVLTQLQSEVTDEQEDDTDNQSDGD